MIKGTYSTIDIKEELILTSNAFKHENIIPLKYTCQGEDISPPLSWNTIETAKSYVLIVDDLDASQAHSNLGEDTFVHWVVFNIDNKISGLPAGVESDALAGFALQGINSFGKKSYNGPCPPAGNAYRYRFSLYAINRILDLPEGATKQQVQDAMKNNIITQTELIGTYQRH